jgi:hypothetical protein
MKQNLGITDKTIRIALAIIMMAIASSNAVNETVVYTLLGISIVFALTSFISLCPFYSLLGIATLPKEKE